MPDGEAWNSFFFRFERALLGAATAPAPSPPNGLYAQNLTPAGQNYVCSSGTKNGKEKRFSHHIEKR